MGSQRLNAGFRGRADKEGERDKKNRNLGRDFHNLLNADIVNGNRDRLLEIRGE